MCENVIGGRLVEIETEEENMYLGGQASALNSKCQITCCVCELV